MRSLAMLLAVVCSVLAASIAEASHLRENPKKHTIV